jgi:hypothetical protein
MAGRWVSDEVWQERDIFNRAPRPALIECEPSRGTVCVRVVRSVLQFLLIGGLLALIILGMFYVAQK